MFVWFINHQLAALFSQNKSAPATSNQPAVLFYCRLWLKQSLAIPFSFSINFEQRHDLDVNAIGSQ
jgi:hypothetical protein